MIPTAVLSTHIRGFKGYTYRDLTEDILPIVRHWKSLDLSFDAIYTDISVRSSSLDVVLKTFEMLKKP